MLPFRYLSLSFSSVLLYPFATFLSICVPLQPRSNWCTKLGALLWLGDDWQSNGPLPFGSLDMRTKTTTPFEDRNHLLSSSLLLCLDLRILRCCYSRWVLSNTAVAMKQPRPISVVVEDILVFFLKKKIQKNVDHVWMILHGKELNWNFFFFFCNS